MEPSARTSAPRASSLHEALLGPRAEHGPRGALGLLPAAAGRALQTSCLPCLPCPPTQGLDYVLAEAQKRGIRVLLVLTDYNVNSGGPLQYLQ